MADTDMLLNKKLSLQMRDAWWNPDTASHYKSFVVTGHIRNDPLNQ
jgi:hypothetical protein